jgi:RNA polymerase sigma-70 factor (ECF subfamily)
VGYDADVAEEVAQATLCKAITKLATYRGEAALFTWLCTFCRHEISAHYRRQGRFGRHRELDEDNPEVRAALELLALDAPAGSEQLVHQKEIARLVQTTLDHLPRKYGDALEWKYIHGLSVADIADRLSLGPKAAESLLTRAREAFREGFGALVRGAQPMARAGSQP